MREERTSRGRGRRGGRRREMPRESQRSAQRGQPCREQRARHPGLGLVGMGI